MIIIQVQNLTKYFGEQVVLKEVSFSIPEKAKVGLVGVNGSGKTTLLQCLIGEIAPDEGMIHFSSQISLGFLQQFNHELELSIWETAMHSFQPLLIMREEMRNLEQKMAAEKGEIPAALADRYGQVQLAYEHQGGYFCENLAKRVLLGLGFAESDFGLLVRSLSGGQKTRLGLALLLTSQPDILILDEPTNHLDITAAEWLEEHLQSYPGTVLLVSHDRMFLDQIVTQVIELRDHKTQTYQGNFQQFLTQRNEADLALARAYAKQQEAIAEREAYISRYRAGIKSKQAAGRAKQLARLERLEMPSDHKRLSLHPYQMQQASGEQVLSVEIETCGFTGLTLLTETGFQIRAGDKIGLVGPNGVGKTTLLKWITGQLKAVAPAILQGNFSWGARVEWSYFSQEFENLNPQHTLLEEVTEEFDILPGAARTMLGSLLFSEDEVFKTITALSGGEKARLALLKLILSGANMLILDEPTNHLDFLSCTAVEEMLKEYPGTLLVVSHDRTFLDRVVNRIVAIDGGKLINYLGNYSDYTQKRKQLVLVPQVVKEAPEVSSDVRTENKKKQREFKQIQKKIDALEDTIKQLEEEKKELEAILSQTNTYQDSGAKAQELAEAYNQVNLQLSEIEESWLLCQEEIALFLA